MYAWIVLVQSRRPGARVLAAVVACLVAAACGGKSSLDVDATSGGGGTVIGPDGGVLPPCGDGRCAADEDCTKCPLDCGLCAGCGDGTCAAPAETCSSCPQDCGVCNPCGDGLCKDGEDCLSCAPDCGACAGCGDGTCDAKIETCFSCPQDCGKCKDCGNGRCENDETCASCPADCGLCSVCGNGKCEGPYETCTNCHEDCGDCQTRGCLSMLTCSFGCIDTSTSPPDVRVSCVADCVSQGCADARFFFDQAFNCFLQHLQECGADRDCLTKACSAEVGVCVGELCK